MDTSTIDQAYQQLQTEFQDVANSIQTLAQKLQAAGSRFLSISRCSTGRSSRWTAGMFGGGGGGGMLGGLLNSGLGRSMEVGAGIGLGEDLINSIF
jgi:hypothetical protein